MMLAHVGQELMDQSRYFHPWSVDSRNQLRDDLEPGVDVDGSETFIESLVHIIVLSVVEHQRQQSQSVLQRGSTGESDGANKTLE